MTYYEELGIRANAEVEEIRRAHRRLVKLMHPDHQRDPHMKLLAETQMRRLNTIVTTLLDPGQRGDYDEALRGRHLARPVANRTWRGVPWWLASTVAATILTIGAIWIWADHLGSSFSDASEATAPQQTANATRVVVPADPANRTTPSNTTSAPVEAPPRTAENAITKPDSAPVSPRSTTQQPSKPVQMAERFRGRDIPASHTNSVRAIPNEARSKHVAVIPVPVKPIPGPINHASGERAAVRHKSFHLPPGVLPMALPSSRPAVALPPAPGVSASAHVETASLSLPLPTAYAPKPELLAKQQQSGLEGEWVYAPKEPEKRKPGFYPPEFINFKLSQQHQGGLQGQYSARYAVSGTNKPISPDVSFQVVAEDKDARKFTWHSTDGSRGTLVVRAIDGRTIRLEWRTTVSSGHPALTSGIATLVRRQ